MKINNSWQFAEGSFASYCSATLCGFAARPLSSSTRQPELRLERFLTMQAVIRLMFGISELHRRNASPVHCRCASAVKAKLGLASAVREIATASVAAIWTDGLGANDGHLSSSGWP